MTNEKFVKIFNLARNIDGINQMLECERDDNFVIHCGGYVYTVTPDIQYNIRMLLENKLSVLEKEFEEC